MQVVLTGFITYVVIAACSVIGGTFTEGLQIVGIAVFSTPLTIAAFVLGLPLRLIPRARSWWFRRAEWTFVVFVLAALVLCLSYVIGRAGPVHYDANAQWPASDGYNPDVRVFVSALGVLAFASMHMLPPRRARRAALDDTTPVTHLA
ncbi:hypothetical protein DEI81_12060 [Curtobacterium sp. MCBD17_013]|nr:hypothetical protein DEI81_12060 [Curtobacterium sp. MCBD17_013]